MIIVEGPDNAGKTTLIKSLIEADPSLRVLHRAKFNPKNGESIGHSYLKALVPPADDEAAHANCIADRFYASECIYGDLFRGGCRMSTEEHVLIRRTLKKIGTIVVFCDPGDAAINGSWDERDQLYKNNSLLAEAYRSRLRAIFEGFAVYHYNYNWMNASDFSANVVDIHKAVVRARGLMNVAGTQLNLFGSIST